MSDVAGRRRVFLSAALADHACHAHLGAVTWRAAELGADPWTTGLIFAAADAVYVIASLRFGHLSDRIGRRGALRTAAAAIVGAGALSFFAADVAVLAVGLVLNRTAAAIFWPTAQARLADGSTRLGRDAGLFNLSWSCGKALGYAANWALLGPLGAGAAAPFLYASATAGVLGFAAPPDARRAPASAPHAPAAPPPRARPRPSPARRSRAR